MTHHIGIFYDKFARKLYAAPGKIVTGRGDRLVFHAINTAIELSAPYGKVPGFHGKRTIKKGKRLSVRIPRSKVTAPAGVYPFKAYSTQYELAAIGGSYPKVIIYD